MACRHPRLTAEQTKQVAEVWNEHIAKMRKSDIDDDKMQKLYVIRGVLNDASTKTGGEGATKPDTKVKGDDAGKSTKPAGKGTDAGKPGKAATPPAPASNPSSSQPSA
jgi:hypothetical protein